MDGITLIGIVVIIAGVVLCYRIFKDIFNEPQQSHRCQTCGGQGKVQVDGTWYCWHHWREANDK